MWRVRRLRRLMRSISNRRFATMVTSLPTLGVGLGFREPFRAEMFLNRERVDFVEITADHFLGVPPEKLAELDLLADHFPVIPHGLNLSLGSAEGLDLEYLDALAALVTRIEPPWWSEHVSSLAPAASRLDT